MAFSRLDRAAVARTLAQIADRPDDLVDAYFERREEVELPPDPGAAGPVPGIAVRREEGLAVRLVRERQTWLAARDEISPRAFVEALRQAARALPAAAYAEPRFELDPWEGPPEAPELAELPSRIERAVRDLHVAFPLRLTVRRHRRWLQVVTAGPAPEPEREEFYSLAAELPWGLWGVVTPRLDGPFAGEVAAALVERFRARHAPPPPVARLAVVLGPAAAAVFLHEAVAHALEVDLLALTGAPESAVGVTLAAPGLSVLDDPGSAPAPVRRTTDDEGAAVRRRWLLREGVVQQPLADGRWAQSSEVLLPGAARRADRHAPPGPRSSHLEVVPGDRGEGELLAAAEGGLWIAEASRGALDPLTGRFALELPMARRIRSGQAAEPVGPCRLGGRVADLLAAIAGVGRTAHGAGAGWCAKGGHKLPVWATSPPLLLAEVEVAP